MKYRVFVLLSLSFLTSCEIAFYFHEDGTLESIDLRRTHKEPSSWKIKSGNRLKIDLEDNDFEKPFKIIELSDERMVWELKKVKVYPDKGTNE